jgi:hypothetical protein
MSKEQTAPDSEDFKKLVEIMALYSESANDLAGLEAELNDELFALLDQYKTDYAAMQSVLTQAETELERITKLHPEWFFSRKSIKTPYGTVKYTSSTKLETENEDASITLIEREEELVKAQNEGKGLPLFDASQFIRQKKELNLEALEKLPDSVLARFRISRVRSESFKVEAAKVDMGKAVKEAAEKGAQ